jgi:hypothetical protein
MKPVSSSNLRTVDPGACRPGLVRLRLIADLSQLVSPRPLAADMAGSPEVACAR